MYRRLISVFCMSVIAFSFITPAAVSAATSKDPAAPSSGVGGLVQPKGKVSPFVNNSLGTGLLLYHGGPVMHTNNVYAIFWFPAGTSWSGGYISTIDQFFKDVAADSGTTMNVYYAATQYYSTGPSYIHYTSHFKAGIVDTHAFPASGCAVYSGVTSCLTDKQIQTEIKRVITQKGWVANGTNEFFIFTPLSVGSCFGTTPGSGCAFTDYCAYHGYFGSGPIIYANMPYTDTVPAACDVTVSPNSNFAADSTISVVSHEHNESITDYKLNAWYDSTVPFAYENGDKCAWIFGSLALGYNQTINGHHYVTQKEWSNHSGGCLLTGK